MFEYLDFKMILLVSVSSYCEIACQFRILNFMYLERLILQLDDVSYKNNEK